MPDIRESYDEDKVEPDDAWAQHVKWHEGAE